MSRIVLISIFLSSILVSVSLQAQDIPALFKKAESYKAAFNDQAALDIYLTIIRQQPANIDALCAASELYSVIGKKFSQKDKQKEFYRKGVELARSALKINKNHSEANFAMAISMGRIALISSGEDKVKAVKEIKFYADNCIRIDPKNYKGYHVLGKWHYEVSDLSSFERWIVKVTYGALPSASIPQAIRYYEKSMQLFPGFLLNYLELAKAYKKNNEKEKARHLLEQLENMAPKTSDDPKIKMLGRDLLNDL